MFTVLRRAISIIIGGVFMDTLMQAASASCPTPINIRDVLLQKMACNQVYGNIWYRFGDKQHNKIFEVYDISCDNLCERIADNFASVPFNCDKVWIGISADNVCSMIPCDYIDIFTCDEMDKFISSKIQLKRWIQNMFCVEQYATVAENSGGFRYIIKHKRFV